MKRTLLISSSEQGAASLGELLKSEGFTPVTVCCSAYSAEQAVERDEFVLICINAPLTDENGIALSRRFAENTRAVVVIVVSQKNADEINDMLNPYGVLVISRPINRHLFHHYLQFSDCFRARILNIQHENEELRTMVEDLKIVDRAKLLLVTCLNMSEDQAHRYLEKQAMDMRISRVEVAKQVIKTYQN